MKADRFLIAPVAIMMCISLMIGCVSNCESCKQYASNVDRPTWAASQQQNAALEEQVVPVMRRQVLDNLAMLLVNPNATPSIQTAAKATGSQAVRTESTVNEVLRAYQMAGNKRAVPATTPTKMFTPTKNLSMTALHDHRNLEAIEIELLHSLGMKFRGDKETAEHRVAQASATEETKSAAASSLMPGRYRPLPDSRGSAQRTPVVIRPGSNSIAKRMNRFNKETTQTSVANPTSKSTNETSRTKQTAINGWLHTGLRSDVPANCQQHFGQHGDVCVWVPQHSRARLETLVEAISMHATVSGEAAEQFIVMHRGTIEIETMAEAKAEQIVKKPENDSRPVTDAEVRDVAREVASEIAFEIREEIGSEIPQNVGKVIVSEVAREFSTEKSPSDLDGAKQVARDVANDIASEIREEIGEAIPFRISQIIVQEVAREFGVSPPETDDADRSPHQPKRIRVASGPETTGEKIKRMSHEISIRGMEYKREQGFLIRQQ